MCSAAGLLKLDTVFERLDANNLGIQVQILVWQFAQYRVDVFLSMGVISA